MYLKVKKYSGKKYTLLQQEATSKKKADMIIANQKKGSGKGTMALGYWSFMRKHKVADGWLVYGRK